MDEIRVDIVPDDDNKVTIGRTTKRFAEVHSTAFTGNLTGNVTGDVTGAVTGDVTGSATRLPAVNLAAATQALTIAHSGQTFVGAVDAVFTLPLASVGAGVYYHFVTGVASAGTGLRITAVTPGEIFGAGVDTGAAGSITNSGATDVVGDCITLVSDGVDQWIGINVRGTWA